MPLRGMNNHEKALAGALRKKGFHVFWQDSGNTGAGDYWATHPQLICQYHVATTGDKALADLETLNNKPK
jgi:hypothetical protein